MRNFLLIAITILNGILLTRCSVRKTERPEPYYGDTASIFYIDSLEKAAENIPGISIGGYSKIIVRHKLFTREDLLSPSIEAQYEARREIAHQLVPKIEKVAARCEKEINPTLKNKILDATERELYMMIQPDLVAAKYGDGHIPDKNGMTTEDIRWYYSVAMQQQIAPIAEWLLSLAEESQRQSMKTIIDEVFESSVPL
ncbi:MAG: hypothetical protein IK073_06640 [Paludibacteraceae bacterium]|nr:hypothetical protein [Paludibacteraceae bacterium]